MSAAYQGDRCALRDKGVMGTALFPTVEKEARRKDGGSKVNEDGTTST